MRNKVTGYVMVSYYKLSTFLLVFTFAAQFSMSVVAECPLVTNGVVMNVVPEGSDLCSAEALPAAVIAAGYCVNTFSSNFMLSNIDLRNTKAPGFDWYPWNYFGRVTNLANIVLNGD